MDTSPVTGQLVVAPMSSDVGQPVMLSMRNEAVVGAKDGIIDGLTEGNAIVGDDEGMRLGDAEGDVDGVALGDAVGDSEGLIDGVPRGDALGNMVPVKPSNTSSSERTRVYNRASRREPCSLPPKAPPIHA